MEPEQREHPLEKGQTWRLEHGYLHIIELGKRLVHYSILRQLNQSAVTTRLIGIVELLIYLKHSEAELMNEQNPVGECLTLSGDGVNSDPPTMS